MSSPPLRVFLKKSEDITLRELTQASKVPDKVKHPAQVFRLSLRGRKFEKIVADLDCSKSKVQRTIHRWQQVCLTGLWDKKSPGKTPKWEQKDLKIIETKLYQEDIHSGTMVLSITKNARN